MLYLYILLVFLGFVILGLVGYLVYKLKKSSPEESTSNSSSSIIWSGMCNDEPNSQCDINNNCSVSCANKIVFASTNTCGKLATVCNSERNCQSSCVQEPRPVVNCTNGFSIWQGQCSSVPSVTTSNRNVTIKCDNEEIISKVLCDETSVRCTKGQCAVCCKVNNPPPEPPPPTCPEGASQVWPSSGAEKCPFIETRTVNEKSKLFCSGQEVFSGQCGELSTLCTNGKCIGCCTPGTVRAPPNCIVGTEVWRTDNPESCSSINTSCEHGTCVATCNGSEVYRNSTEYTNIANRCNNVGCVVCAM